MARKKNIRDVKIPEFNPDEHKGQGITQLNVRISKLLKSKLDTIADRLGWSLEMLVESRLWESVKNTDWREEIKDELVKTIRSEMKDLVSNDDVKQQLEELSNAMQQTIDFATAELIGPTEAAELRLLKIERDLIYKIAIGKPIPSDPLSLVAVERLIQDDFVYRSTDGYLHLVSG